MAGGITLSPLSAGVSVAASNGAAGGSDGGAAADFGCLLGSALSIAVGKDELGIAERLGAQPLLKPASETLPASTEDGASGQQASLPAPDVLAQLMVAMSGQLAVPGQISPHEVDTDGTAAVMNSARGLKAKPVILSADTATVLRATPESSEHGAVADELAFAVDSGLISSKTVAAKFADPGKSLPGKAPLVGRASQETQIIAPQYSSALVENRTAVAGHAQEAITVAVGRPGWGEELGQKMLLLVRGNQQSAELQLNPPNLGPLEIRLSLQNDQASLMFVSAHSSVRDAINAALPKLSSMFAESGIAMGSVLVGDQSLSQQQQQSQRQFQEQSGRSGGFAGNGDDLAVQRFDLPLTRGQGWAVSMFV